MFQELLEKIGLELDKRGIAYMLIGGQAVLFYGEPRLTKDIDVVIDAGPDRLADILNLVKDLEWKALVEEPETFVRQTLVLPCVEPQSGIRVDFIFSFSLYERQAMERVRRVTMGKTQVRFASVEDLIIHKIIAGRPRDLEDVTTILIKNPNVDENYIRLWLKQFEEILSQPLLERFNKTREASQ